MHFELCTYLNQACAIYVGRCGVQGYRIHIDILKRRAGLGSR